jgi:hypothetical protein
MRQLRGLRGFAAVPLAVNHVNDHYTVWRPDLAKTGGLRERSRSTQAASAFPACGSHLLRETGRGS